MTSEHRGSKGHLSLPLSRDSGPPFNRSVHVGLLSPRFGTSHHCGRSANPQSNWRPPTLRSNSSCIAGSFAPTTIVSFASDLFSKPPLSSRWSKRFFRANSTFGVAASKRLVALTQLIARVRRIRLEMQADVCPNLAKSCRNRPNLAEIGRTPVDFGRVRVKGAQS